MTDMIRFQLTLDPMEIRTRELFNTVEWTSNRQLVANVFVALWASSFTREQLEKIGAAMHNLRPVDLSETLTELVRLKVLRSRTHRGVRLYEVNY